MTIDSPITLRSGKNIGGTPPTNNLPPIGHPIDPSAATGAGGSIPPPLVSTQSGLPGVSPLHNNGLKSPPYITGLGEVLDDPASSVRGRHGSLANSEEEIAKEYMITFNNSKEDYEDEFNGMSLSDIPDNQRQKYVQLAERNKEDLKRCIRFFCNKPNYCSTELLESMKSLKLAYIELLRSSWVPETVSLDWDHSGNNDHGKSVEPPPINNNDHSSPLDPPPGRNDNVTPDDIRRDRLLDQFNVQSTLAIGVHEDFKSLKAMSVTSRLQLRSWVSKWTEVSACINELIPIFNDLSQNALAIADGPLSRKSDETANNLRELARSGRKLLAQHEEVLQINTLNSHSGWQNDRSRVKVKVPTFTGSYKDTDYFTFVKAYKEYLEAVGGLSVKERYLLLRNECLQGEALTSCSSLNNEEAILKQLKTLYGRSQILFAHRIQEIEEVGNCPSAPLPMRSWTINVSTKMKALTELAATHGLTSQLEHSAIISKIQAMMTNDMRKDFKTKLFEKLDPEEELSKQKICHALQDFLSLAIKQATFDVDYQLNISSSADDFSLSKKSDNKHKSKTFLNTDSPLKALEDCSSNNIPVAAVGSTRSNTSNNKPGDTTKSNNTSKVKKLIALTSLTDKPQVKDCSLCNKKHTYLSHCVKFQEAQCRERWGLCVKSQTCPRCLRLDAIFPGPKLRDQWFQKHQSVCTEDWLCNVDKCKEVKVVARNHFLLCRFHVEEGKAREADFKKSLDSRFVPADTRFYFSNPEDEVASSEAHMLKAPLIVHDADIPDPSKVHSSYVGKYTDDMDTNDIADNMSVAPIYMVQNVASPSGEPLFLFYDSGCLGACINSNAYGLLKTETVRPGPTNLEVAAGHVVKINHGDERIHLPLRDGGSASITALRMEDVSRPFPAWSLLAAWQDLQKDFQNGLSREGSLPEVENVIGGVAVDIMLGIRYIKYFPTLIHSLPSGLSIFASKFESYNQKYGILGGPHASWCQALKVANLISPAAYLNYEVAAYNAINSSMLCNFSQVKTAQETSSFFLDKDTNVSAGQFEYCHEPITDEGYEDPITNSCFLQACKAKSKIVTDKSVPNAELMAAVTGASLGHLVQNNFGSSVGSILYATDSSIILQWLSSDTPPLQTYVHNAVIEILRLSPRDDWFHIPTNLNPADSVTRTHSVSDVLSDSICQVGFECMSKPINDMPLHKVADIVLSGEERVAALKEVDPAETPVFLNLPIRLSACYDFSNYFIDPLYNSWDRYLRSIAVIFRTYNIMREADKFSVFGEEPAISFTHEDISRAETYIFNAEVVHFIKKEKPQNIGKMKDGILRYIGRLLDGSKMNNLTLDCIDLAPLHFSNPIIDHSTVALAIICYAHTTLACCAGVPTVLPYDRLETQLGEIELAWWIAWSVERLHAFLPDRHIGPTGKEGEAKEDDIVIFTREGGEEGEEWGNVPWRLGRVISVDDGASHARSLWIEYSNGKEKKLRRTYRSIRTVAVIHREEDLDRITTVNSCAMAADLHLFASCR